METIKKIKQNLHLIGDKVYSYETHVATIQGNNLVEHGKYSNTTTKHVSHVAKMLGLNIVRSSEKPSYNKLDYGAVIKF